MCRTFTILILLFVITEVNETNAQRMIHDTLFLQRDVRRIAADSFNSQDRIDYSGVFVEKDRSSKSYKYVLNYNFKQITVLGRYRPNSKIDHEAMKEIPSRWYPVRSYHDKFFILSQDAYNKDLLTDTAYIVRSMEGAFSNGLNAFEKINKNTYQLNANTWHDKTFNLRIHVLIRLKHWLYSNTLLQTIKNMTTV